MKLNRPSKKIMLATIFTSALTLGISQAALAQAVATDEQKQGPEHHCQVQTGSEMQKAHEKFLNDTVGIRKELAEKNAAMRALINAGTPDTVKASQISGEVFDLREKLRTQAKEAGMPCPMLMMGAENEGMPCQGMGHGMGHGMMKKRHHHRGMM